MSRDFPEQLLARLSECVVAQTGLHFPPERWRDLERGIRLAARELGDCDAESYARQLLNAPMTRKQIEVLASGLTVGETYFFREERSFAILRESILPELIRERRTTQRRLRIWSAGCCTGEEPYSIAMLLDQTLPDLREWQVLILGTDINPHFLRKAHEGVFSEWSFRGTLDWLKEHYFQRIGGGRFEILPRIREMITFGYLNLSEDTYPSLCNNTNAMDLIFCRNVLMYFKSDRTRNVIGNFHRSLLENGWLIVSPTETSTELFLPFTPVHFKGATFYRKGAEPSRPTAYGFDQRSDGDVAEETGIYSGFGKASVQDNDRADVARPAVDSRQERLSDPEDPPHTSSTGQPTAYEEAVALFNEGRYADAVRKLDPPSSDHRASPEHSSLLARIHANLGELAKARAWAEQALVADKLNPGLHYLRAVILQEQGASEDAKASLKRALYLAPDFVLAHFALGNLALQQGNSMEADRHFTNALGALSRYQADEVLPQSDGLAAGRLKELIESTMSIGRSA